MTSGNVENLIIVGRGAAAYTAAIYAARASLAPWVIEPSTEPKYLGDVGDGSTPGFPQAKDAESLLSSMRGQAERFGAQLRRASELRLEARDGHLVVHSDGKDCRAKAVILAEGSRELARKCEFLPHEADGRMSTKGSRSQSRGVFACADAVRDSSQLPIIVAAGAGCQACIDAERWLQAIGATAPDQHSERW